MAGMKKFGVLFRSVHQSYMVVTFSVGVIVGAIIGIVFRINYFASPVWIGAVVVLLVLAYLKPKLMLVVVALIAGMILVFFRIAGELMGENYVRELVDKDVVVMGVVDGDPETDETVTKCKLRELRIGEVELKGNLYVSLNKNEELGRGDRVELAGKMASGFGVYAGYMYRPKLTKWERPEPGDLVLKVRNWFAERIRGLLPEPEASLGLSYLLGMRTGLSDELNENLRTVGLVHIVVASGAHLAILVEVARKIFGRASRFAGLLFSVLFVTFFMCMVGWTPSILRAGVMTSLALVAWYFGRKMAPWRLILVTMAFTLVIEPMYLTNLSWLLSFASYAGIMMLGPKMRKLFYGLKKPGFVGEMVIVTASATLMTLPLTLYYYGAVSLISVVANLLILPTLPYAMGLVFMTGVAAGIPGVEVVVSWCAKMLIDFHIAVVNWFGGMRQFLVEIPTYKWQVFLIYVVILTVPLIGLIKRKVVKLREVDYKF